MWRHEKSPTVKSPNKKALLTPYPLLKAIRKHKEALSN